MSSLRRQNEIEFGFILAVFPNVLLSSNRDISCRFLDAYYKQFTDRTGDTGGVSIGGSGGGRTDSDVAVALSTPLFPDAVPSASLAANGAAAAGISTLGRAIAGLNKSDSADVLNSFDPEAILTPGKYCSSKLKIETEVMIVPTSSFRKRDDLAEIARATTWFTAP